MPLRRLSCQTLRQIGPPFPRRPTCERCLRPRATCLCSWVTLVEASVEVLILQHPLEEHHAKGSARLLHLSLPGSRVVVGEAFASDAMQSLLYDSPNSYVPQKDAGGPPYPMLLYPQTPIDAHATSSGCTAMDNVTLTDPSRVRLVVLDATWRKSRKMLHLNPQLQYLPRLSLTGLPPSDYRVRKTNDPTHFSTLEAVVHALVQLESPGSREKYQPLLDGFAAFVDRLESFAGGAA